MKLLFARSLLPGSLLIRLLTLSRWSHVAAVNDDGWAIEATWPRVRKVKVEEIIASHSAHEWRELPMPPDAWAWLERQIGKPYDLGFLFAFFAPWRDWRLDDRWACSELVACAAGVVSTDGRLSPQMLYILSRESPPQTKSSAAA